MFRKWDIRDTINEGMSVISSTFKKLFVTPLVLGVGLYTLSSSVSLIVGTRDITLYTMFGLLIVAFLLPLFGYSFGFGPPSQPIIFFP